MTLEELKSKLEANTTRLKAIEVKIQALLDAVANEDNVSPELQAASDALEAEIGNTETEVQ